MTDAAWRELEQQRLIREYLAVWRPTVPVERRGTNRAIAKDTPKSSYGLLQQRLKADQLPTKGGPVRVLILTASLLALLIAPTFAQTATYKLQWSMPDAPAVAQGYAYSLKTSPTATAQALTVTCVASGSGSTCTSAALPAPAVSGATVTATNAYGSATSDPVMGAPPAKPGSITVVVTVAFP